MTRPSSVSPPARWWITAVACLLPVLAAASLIGGIAGGLLRAGVALPGTAGAGWLADVALAHAASMVCGFMGTAIGVERAVALKSRAAWLAPLASSLGGICLLTGQLAAGAWLQVAAGIFFTAVNLVLVRRQPASHTMLLLGSAIAWLTGNLMFASGQGSTATVPWWFGFLVMTIAAERLEMTRLMRRRAVAQPFLYVLLAAMLAGSALSAVLPAAGGVLYGAALLLLAWWLVTFDIARRTLFAEGLARYMAVCLLGGYFWLALAGVAWVATALGLPARDVALHALGLGFTVSMMMGHAPVILPAVARVKLHFSGFFYLPLAALHLSLLVRLGLGFADLRLRAAGAVFNALAIALFAATALAAALAWRIHHGARGAGQSN